MPRQLKVMFPNRKHSGNDGGDNRGGGGTSGDEESNVAWGYAVSADVHTTEHHASNVPPVESTRSSFSVPPLSLQPPAHHDDLLTLSTSSWYSDQVHQPRPPQCNSSSSRPLVKHSHKDDDECAGYTERDILCGKGGRVNHHAGNRVFLRLVQRNKDHYRRLEKKASKDMVIRSILLSLQQNGRRFRQWNTEIGQWKTISWERAYNKVRQALREPDRIVHKAAILANEMAAARRKSPQNEEVVVAAYQPTVSHHYHYLNNDNEEYSTLVATNPTTVERPIGNTTWQMSTRAENVSNPRRYPEHDMCPLLYQQTPGATSFSVGTLNGSSNAEASSAVLEEEYMPPALQSLLEREDSMFLSSSTEFVWK
jgi:hypothetical protein